MKETMIKFLTWLAGSATVAGILHLIPVVLAIVAGIFWVGMNYYKRHAEKTNDKKATIELEIAELQLKKLQQSINVTQPVSGSCQNDQ